MILKIPFNLFLHHRHRRHEVSHRKLFQTERILRSYHKGSRAMPRVKISTLRRFTTRRFQQKTKERTKQKSQPS